MIKTIIFDFDGVILDSNKAKGQAFVKLFKNQNQNIKKKIYDFHINNIGKSREYKIKHIIKNILKKKLSKNNLSFLSKKFSLIVFEKVIKSKYILGVKEFLKYNSANYNFHLSTATPYNEIISILQKKKIFNFFDSIHGSPESKDQHIKKILKNWKYKKKEIIFIGDSLNDYRVAKKNGIIFFGIKNEFNNFDKLKFSFTDFNQIKTTLKKIS